MSLSWTTITAFKLDFTLSFVQSVTLSFKSAITKPLIGTFMGRLMSVVDNLMSCLELITQFRHNVLGRSTDLAINPWDGYIKPQKASKQHTSYYNTCYRFLKRLSSLSIKGFLAGTNLVSFTSTLFVLNKKSSWSITSSSPINIDEERTDEAHSCFIVKYL